MEMNKIITIGLSFVNLFIAQNTFAQEKRKFSIGLDYGFSITKDVDLRKLSIEPGYQIHENLNIGLAIMYSSYGRIPHKSINNQELGNPQPEIKESFNGAVVVEYRPYRIKNIMPYFGLGLGIYPIRNVEIIYNTLQINEIEYEFESVLGGVLRAGVEVRKFRAGIEYNFLRESKINGFYSENNNSFNISVGFVFGGGYKKDKENE